MTILNTANADPLDAGILMQWQPGAHRPKRVSDMRPTLLKSGLKRICPKIPFSALICRGLFMSSAVGKRNLRGDSGYMEGERVRKRLC